MRKTKIICTLGPTSSTEGILKEMVKGGLDVARLNFSHGTWEEHKEKIEILKKIEKELARPIGIMLDTKGPEIRTGVMKNGEVELIEGNEITVIAGDEVGDQSCISITYKHLARDFDHGTTILLDDGLIELKVIETKEHEVICKIINGGILGSHKGVNIPCKKLDLPGLTRQDREDIKFGIKNGIHFIAASFIRKAADVIEIRKLLEEEWVRDIKIIAKIENQEGVNNINEIIEVADGIMVARGDLGVEMPTEKVPIIQKMIISKCNQEAIPVITATQMLESMIRNPRPTRAEASDVANAIFDGTDAIMLSGESAIGKHPLEAVKTMAKIAEETESSTSYKDKLVTHRNVVSETITEAISFASCKTAEDLGAEAIITPTGSGSTARMISKMRPLNSIIAVTPNEIVYHTLTLSWGVCPLLISRSDSTDEMIDNSVQAALEHNLVKDSDLVTITAGVPVGTPGTTNLIKIDIVGKPLIEGQGIGKGIITGKAKKVSTADEAIEKVAAGDILITRMTNKQFIPAMKKAAAIITVEGGLTSHSALEGLNLGIPVIVSAGEIMDVVEDDELITVDGVRGLVYKGKVNLK